MELSMDRVALSMDVRPKEETLNEKIVTEDRLKAANRHRKENQLINEIQHSWRDLEKMQNK